MAESTGTSSSSGTESDSSSSDSDIDDFRTGSRHGKRSKYAREVENKKTKLSRSKTRKTYRRKSGRKDRHASKGDEKNEPVYTALVRKDSSDSFIPFMFSLKSVNAFDLFKTKVLNACSTSRTNAQLYHSKTRFFTFLKKRDLISAKKNSDSFLKKWLNEILYTRIWLKQFFSPENFFLEIRIVILLTRSNSSDIIDISKFE